MTTNRVFAAEVVRRINSRRVACRYFVLDSDPKLTGMFGRGKTYVCKSPATWSKAFDRSQGESTWISTTAEHTRDLIRAASVFVSSRRRNKLVLGDLLMLESPRAESLPALRSFFRNVVGEVNAFRLLPAEELAVVLVAPRDAARDVFIGGLYDPATQTLSLTRGNLRTVVVPLSLLEPSGTSEPDPTALAVTDYGHTVKLGEYEASADAILYEIDPDYRRRMHARRRREEQGFGPALRRLRIQRRLKRTDFPGISPKTIARIERGETGRPHGRTLNILASCLRVEPNEIETF